MASCKNCMRFWARETIYRVLLAELTNPNETDKDACVSIARETGDEILNNCWGNRTRDVTGAAHNMVVEKVIGWATERMFQRR